MSRIESTVPQARGARSVTIRRMPHLLNLLRGFLMGSADVVPGVSGGTIALVLGIYERLVRAIRTGAGALGSLVRGRFGEALQRARAVEWRFLLPLLIGIVLAIVSLAAVINHFLDEEPINTSAFFLGLVAASIVIAWSLVTRWDARRVGVALAIGITTFLILGLRSGEVSDPATALFFGAGAIAIIAMILPGISGSFILLMLGMYEAAIEAVDKRELISLAAFAAGAVIGLALFSTLLDRMLRDHHDTMMAGLIGLMAGSLRVLWPWPAGIETGNLAAPSEPLVPVILAIVGFAVVTAIGWWGKQYEAE